ncbi:MBL fold metallo-hydrolase [Stenotrophomonas maltophilia]|uniref:MBL fold metallo-hydrolase n=1 Tax=Stenotrophomonas TaxID=40323 RepID=UPI00130F8D6F|nr:MULTISPECIES: MBL fold metallo-hydrolase [Stenotrophomonas]MBA0279076.1 MBL fold metallo-hydrolase [Stenotrophomonas maltophilia]MBA0414605.1 MBL fold metallo-hydrolase [Stenotrophomonas maltophilia]MBA0500012.1 MBL fold metallo-hydrolase [Stenotrophomonas maltophilia]MBA0504497.1 MBL fold metallo-hydrolase [Stenotrophomonas maltophilia]MBA0508763.1 MBL fold metallo-hydrolase [Stenotrophomonas maltophilia]
MSKPLPVALGLMLAMGAPLHAFGAEASPKVSIQQIRNATIKVTYGGQVFLVDPMLARKGTYPGFAGTYRSHLRNPLVELPESVESVLAGVDAVLVSHTHLDHWDNAAQKEIPKSLPMFVQNDADAALLRKQGFKDVRILDANTVFNGVRISKAGARHGSKEMYAIPEVAKGLGATMGFVFQQAGLKTVYVAGDTVWEAEVRSTLEAFKPDVVVLNTGDARLDGFNTGIIMGKEDTLRVHQMSPNARIVAVHMDAVNHMSVSRYDLQDYVIENGIESSVVIPQDGEVIDF